MPTTTAADHAERLLKNADFFYRTGQLQKANETYWLLLEREVDDETRRTVEERLNEIASRRGSTVAVDVADDGEGPGVGRPVFVLACVGQAALAAFCLWQAIRGLGQGAGQRLEPLVAAAIFGLVFLGLLSMRGRVAGHWRRVAAAANVFAGGVAASSVLWLAPQIDLMVRSPSRESVIALVVLVSFGGLVFGVHKALRAREVFDPPAWLWWVTRVGALGVIVADAQFRFWLSLRLGSSTPEQIFANALESAMSGALGGQRTDLLLLLVWAPLAVAGFYRSRPD